MEFRLFYEGRFLSANGDPRQGGPTDRLADHKHAIRREFHAQLKHYWEINPALATKTSHGEIFGLPSAPDRPLAEVTADVYTRHGYRFVPLVCRPYHLTCKVEVLVLRRDQPGGIFDTRDLDNRLKVLFDALKMPRDLAELGTNSPQSGEDPFYVLLESDDLITHASVETDLLLDPPTQAGKDDSYARVLVKVTLHPSGPSIFGLSFI